MVAVNAKRSVLTIIIILSTFLLEPGKTLAVDKCRECHDAIGDKPSLLFKHDVHSSSGVTCAGCHGGDATVDDMERAMNKEAGFLGIPKGDDISRACATCHSSSEKMKGFRSSLSTGQLEMLQASVHGQRSTSGKEQILQCTTCHNAHGIVSVKNPSSPVYQLNVVKTCATCHSDAAFIRSYNPALPVDQLEKYKTSLHGLRNAKKDAKVAECASCHGSHNILPAKNPKSKVHAANLPGTCAKCHSNPEYMKGYDIPTDQYENFAKSVHGIALLGKHDLSAPACNDCHGNHGATPPGVESIAKVCGECHALNAELFSSSPHKKAFDELQLPECETCHGSHDIAAPTSAMVGVDDEAICSRCHSGNERPKGFQVAAVMRGLIDSLEHLENHAQSLVRDAEQKGMEIGEAKFKLRDVHQSRLETRTVVHAFDEPKFREVAIKGLATAEVVQEEAEHAIEEFYFRRVGLGISTLIITVLAVSLYLFIHRLERIQQQRKSATF